MNFSNNNKSDEENPRPPTDQIVFDTSQRDNNEGEGEADDNDSEEQARKDITEKTYSEGDSSTSNDESSTTKRNKKIMINNDDDDNNNNDNEGLLSSTFKAKPGKTTNAIETEWARRDAEQDQELERQLHKAVEDAGRWAYGIIAVEVWALDEKKSSGAELYPPTGGLWMDPLAHRDQCNSTTGCRACRLTNPELASYIPPDPVAVGEGLPGILWSESDSTANTSSGSYRLHWRHIPELVDDPHRQWNARMQWWVECGITWAAGIPFHGHNHQKGIIIYLARSGISHELLGSAENQDYLKAVSDQIASLYSVNSSRRRMIAKRRAERNAVLRRIKIKLLAVVRFGGSIKTLTENEQEKRRKEGGGSSDYGSDYFDFENASQQSFDPWRQWKGKWMNSFNSRTSIISFTNPLVSFKRWAKWAQQKVYVTCKKTKGKGVNPPPLPSWDAAILAGIGSFLTLLLLARFNVFLIETLGGEYSIVIGPMGAFLTLLYGLTAAPAAQPLNAMVGQAMAMVIGILFSRADALDIYYKQSIATGLTILIMVKLGLTHPPAGASALVFASGKFGFGNMAFTMFAVWVTIIIGALINNLHSKRQYPTFWGFYYVISNAGMDQCSIKV